jgi:hypothetical protein
MICGSLIPSIPGITTPSGKPVAFLTRDPEYPDPYLKRKKKAAFCRSGFVPVLWCAAITIYLFILG